MSKDKLTDAQAEEKLWDSIDHHNTGMLGLIGQHHQPMTAFVEKETGQIWFFTRKDTDMARDVGGGGAKAMYVHQAPGLQACIEGRLTLQHDRARMDKYWNAVVAAWYPEGKDDPQLTMLCFDADDARVWLSDGPVKFFYEIAKANATKTTPDVGKRANLDLH